MHRHVHPAPTTAAYFGRYGVKLKHGILVAGMPFENVCCPAIVRIEYSDLYPHV